MLVPAYRLPKSGNGKVPLEYLFQSVSSSEVVGWSGALVTVSFSTDTKVRYWLV